jgi:hypothetical protein
MREDTEGTENEREGGRGRKATKPCWAVIQGTECKPASHSVEMVLAMSTHETPRSCRTSARLAP